jgi:S1-C subfamily serine protease
LLGLALAASLAAAAASALPDGGAAGAPAVLLAGDDLFGSGIVWGDGHVLTALHVVEEMSEIRIVLADGRSLRARIVDQDPVLDLALLRAEGPLAGSAAVCAPPGAASRGDAVRLAGFPERRAFTAAATILEPDRRFAGARYLALAGCARPGASGGPVLDASGAVIGIVDLVLAERDVTLAIPIDAALARFPQPATRQGSPR